MKRVEFDDDGDKNTLRRDIQKREDDRRRHVNDSAIKRLKATESTSILTAEAKCIDPRNLQDNVSTNTNTNRNKKEEKEREKEGREGREGREERESRELTKIIAQCKLCELMLCNPSVEELNTYVVLARDSLTTQGVFPIDPDNTRDIDEAIAEEVYSTILHGNDVSIKKAFIWTTLFVSREFISVFCPPASSSRRFLCDPNKLMDFIDTPSSPFIEIFSRYIIGNYGSRMFNALCAKEWFEISPWENMAEFAKLNPANPSVEVQILSGAMNESDHLAAHDSLAKAHNYYRTTRAELGSAATRGGALHKFTPQLTQKRLKQ